MDKSLRDLIVFRNLIKWLYDSHSKQFDYLDQKVKEVYDEIAVIYPKISEREVEEAIPSQERVVSEFPPRKYLYLNPVTKGPALLPILSINANFGRSIPELRIRLGLFLKHDDRTKAFGYRFESPEGPGMHHYYHAQMIHDFTNPSFALESIWLSDRCPTFPLDADDPVKLCLALLVALYGVEYITQIRQSVYGINEYLDAMHCLKFPAFEWYWMVKIGKNLAKKREEFWSTRDEPNEFARSFRGKYQKCEIIGITSGTWKKHGGKQWTAKEGKK